MRDLVGGLETGVGLDDDVQARVVTAFAQQIVQPYDLVRGAHLRQHQCRRRGVARQHRLDIGDAERLAHAVDAHDALHAIVGLRLGEQRHRAGSRGRLVLRRDAVLELDADDVRTARERLGIHLGLQAGREDEASAGANDAFSHDVPNSRSGRDLADFRLPPPVRAGPASTLPPPRAPVRWCADAAGRCGRLLRYAHRESR